MCLPSNILLIFWLILNKKFWEKAIQSFLWGLASTDAGQSLTQIFLLLQKKVTQVLKPHGSSGLKKITKIKSNTLQQLCSLCATEPLYSTWWRTESRWNEVNQALRPIYSVYISRVSALCAQSVDAKPGNSSTYALEKLRLVVRLGQICPCFMHAGSMTT